MQNQSNILTATHLIKTYLTKYLIKATDFSQFQKNGSKCGDKSVLKNTDVEQNAKAICLTACVGLTRMKTCCLCYKSVLRFCFREHNGGGGGVRGNLSEQSSQEEGEQCEGFASDFGNLNQKRQVAVKQKANGLLFKD